MAQCSTDKDELIKEYKRIIEFCRKAGLSEYEEKLGDKLEDLVSPLKIMIVGEGKSGKSTLLNALVGVDVAQVNDEPKTWCINLYTDSDDGEYAELVYPDEIRRVSVSEADAISERISNSDTYESLSDDDQSLREIRWHINLKWPQKEIYIIDTPGFNQVRKDTSVETIEIDGVDGVKFAARESFDRYYYKADLVLWCFEATSVGDREVEEHLKSVYKQGKRIYGIITKLDREEDPETREKLFLENDRRYKKYNLVTSIRSGLPTIYDDDDEDEIAYKTGIRNESIESIRRCIDYLLNDNKEADEIKTESSRRYLEEIKEHIGSIESKILEFYDDNLAIAVRTADGISREFDSLIRNYGSDIRFEADNAASQMKSQAFLMNLWQTAGSDVNSFAELVSRSINNSEFVEKCGRKTEEYFRNTEAALNHNLTSMKFKSVTLSMDDPDSGETYTDEISTGNSGMIFNTSRKEFSIDMEQMGMAYQIMQLFEKDSTVYQVINLLAGDMIRDRAFGIAADAIEKNISQICEEYIGSFTDEAGRIRLTADRFVNERLKKHTGYDIDEMPRAIIDLEEKLIELDVFHDDGIVYYPQLKGDRLIFKGSLYRQRFKMEPKAPPRRAAGIFIDQYAEDIFAARIIQTKEEIISVMEKYDGTAPVRKVVPAGGDYRLSSDDELLSKLPPVSKINWLGLTDDMARAYLDRRDRYLEDMETLWKQQGEVRQKAVMSGKVNEIKKKYRPGIDRFLTAWKAQMEADIPVYLNSQNWYSLPDNTDYYEYYVRVYSRYNPQDMLIRTIWEYEQNGTIPGEDIDRFMVTGYSGKKLTGEIKDAIKQVYAGYLKEMAAERSNCLKAWDYYFTNYERSFRDVCDAYLNSLDMTIKSQIKPGWEKYKSENDIRSSNACRTIIEYAVKSGKMTKGFRDFLAGDIPELRSYANIIRADGSRMSEYWKGYTKERLMSYMSIWN